MALRLSIIAARMLLTELRLGSARPMAMGMDATAIITGTVMNTPAMCVSSVCGDHISLGD